MENLPKNAPKEMTVRELEAKLATIKNKDLPIQLVIEHGSQYADTLREVIVSRRYIKGDDEGEDTMVILMGLERLCPEYEEVNPKIKT